MTFVPTATTPFHLDVPLKTRFVSRPYTVSVVVSITSTVSAAEGTAYNLVPSGVMKRHLLVEVLTPVVSTPYTCPVSVFSTSITFARYGAAYTLLPNLEQHGERHFLTLPERKDTFETILRRRAEGALNSQNVNSQTVSNQNLHVFCTC